MKAVETAVINNATLTVLVEAGVDSIASVTYFLNGIDVTGHSLSTLHQSMFECLAENLCNGYCLKNWKL